MSARRGHSALTSLHVGFIVAALCPVYSSPACSNERQSTITKLQQRVHELESLLSKCDSRLRAAIQNTREHTRTFAGGPGSTSRQLLQSPSHTSDELQPTEVVTIGFLHPMTGSAAGKFFAGAATLAIADINADPTIMHGRRLDYIAVDSGCSSMKGVAAIHELLRADKRIHGVHIHILLGVQRHSTCRNLLCQIAWLHVV